MNITRPSEEIEKRVFNKIKTLILQNKEIENHIDGVSKSYITWSKRIRKNYLPKECEVSFAYDVKVDYEPYLKYTLKMNKKIEKINNKFGTTHKLFQPVPLRNSMVPKYVTIDTNAMFNFFKKKGETQKKLKEKPYVNELWSRLFKTDKRVMKKKNYDFSTIQTDGIAVSICFINIDVKKKRKITINDEENGALYIDELNKSDLKICETRKLIGVDPGKHNLVYMVDENRNKLRYTASQRKVESKSKKCNAIILKERTENKIIEKETTLSIHNSKTVNFNKFKEFIKEKTKVYYETIKFYKNKIFRKFRWRTQISARKSEEMKIPNF